MKLAGAIPALALLDENEYLEPDWENPPPNTSDWMECVSDDLRAIWHTFTPEQRRVIYRNAEDCWSSLNHERYLSAGWPGS